MSSGQRAQGAGAERSYAIGPSTLTVRFGDLLDSTADVLVSSDDYLLSMGGGVSAAIARRAGSGIVVDAVKAVPRDLGDVVVTTAGALEARYVFHVVTVGPSGRGVSSGGDDADFDLLKVVTRATRKCLQLADALGVSSIAFPSIGAGVAGIAPEVVAAGMTNALHDTLLSLPRPFRVELCLMPKSWQSEHDSIVFFEELARRSTRPLEPVPPRSGSVGEERSGQAQRILELNSERAQLENQLLATAGDPASAAAVDAALTANSHEMVGAIKELAPTQLFVSYAHDDQEVARQFTNHLSGLNLAGLAIWHDAMIEPGTDWEHELRSALEAAQIGVFLISASFLASPYCVGKEWKRALERRDAGELTLMPVILKPCDWEDFVGHIQVLPEGGQPITGASMADQAMLDVALAIKKRIKAIREG